MSSTMVTTMTEVTDVLTWEIRNLVKCFDLDPTSVNKEYMGTITSDPMEVAKESTLHSKWTFKLTSQKRKSGVAQLVFGVHFHSMLAKNRFVYHPEENEDVAFILCAYDISLASGPGQSPFATVKKSRYSHMFDWRCQGYEVEEDFFVFTKIMPLRDFVTKHAELCPGNKLVIQITFTTLFDANHLTLPNLKSGDNDNRHSKDSLVKSYSRMWTDDSLAKFSDFKIKCGDPTVTFHVHKAILAARSPFFETYFADRWANSSTNPREYQVEECEPEAFKSLLKFIYAADFDIPAATEKEALLNLIYAAEKYELPELKAACFDRMFTNIGDENAGEFAVAAFNYNADEDSSKLIRGYCSRRHEHLIKQPKYNELFKNKPAAFLGD